jgi:hypothetical protein
VQAHEGSLVEVQTPAAKPIHHSLPIRPAFAVPQARTEVKNANMSAAEALRIKLAGTGDAAVEFPVKDANVTVDTETEAVTAPDAAADYDEEGQTAGDDSSPRGKKRKAVDDRPVPTLEAVEGEEAEVVELEDDDEEEAPPNPEADQPLPIKKLKKNPDGTVDYEDTVKSVYRLPRRLVPRTKRLFQIDCGSLVTESVTTVKSLASNSVTSLSGQSK